ncbi:MAG: GNAT family N-acetyltransferase [Lysobacterales bacterium]
MTAPLQFRPATPDDVDALLVLVESAYRGDVSRQGWTTEADLLDGQRTDRDGLLDTIAREGSIILLAERDGELLGCANLERQGDAAYFGMFAVRPGLQGGGIGDAILRECEQRARNWGLSQVRMTVIWPRVELIAFYLRRGYAATGQTAPFPYGDERFGKPRRQDLYFEVYAKNLTGEV